MTPPPLHCLVSRRPPALRPPGPACGGRDRRAGDLPLCARRGEPRGARRRPLGGAARWWLAQSLRALTSEPRKRGAPLVLRKGAAAKIIAGLARETGAGAVFWNEIAQAPQQRVADQVAAALAAIGVAVAEFPGDLLAPPSQIRNKENRGLRVFTPFWRRVQSLGDPPKPLPAPKKLRRQDPISRAIALERLAARADAARLGRRLARELDSLAKPRRRARLKAFLAEMSPAMPAIATGPTATAPRACRRICASARSARDRSGTPRALPRPSTRACQPTSTNSSANSAGASSAGICCSTYPISRRATCSPPSMPFPGSATTRRCAPGSAAGPAIPSSMPACASSGTPA